MSEELVEKLKQLLETMKDWERKPLVKAGRAIVEIVKAPKRETRRAREPERLVLHVRLEDSFKGVYLRSLNDLEDVVKALTSPRVKEVAKAIDELNRSMVIEYSL